LSDPWAPDAVATGPALPAGRIGRPHGLDGSFYVTRPKPRLLVDRTLLTVAGEERKVIRRAGTEQRPILRLEGIESREAVEALRGSDLTVNGAEAPQLAEGEWWAHELEGCEVLDGGLLLGTVARMIELPSCEALEVKRAGGGEQLLVPMVKAAIRSVDTAARRIDVDAAFLGLEADAQRGQDA
jgi:16S rRNA processing protein RimM